MSTEVEAERFCHVDRSEGDAICHVDRSGGDAEQRRNAAETSVRSVAPKLLCIVGMYSVFPRSRCLRSILCVATLLEDSGRHDRVVIAMRVSAFQMSPLHPLRRYAP